MMRVVWEFTKREARRFLRQKGRLIATLATPIVFWVMVGHGFGSLLEETFLQTNSLHFFFPGILLMTVLFSSIFSMISLVEDRNEGFLQGVRLVPQAAIKIVLGKVSATSFLALLQTLLVVLLAPLIGVKLSVAILVELLFIVGLASLLLSLLGFMFAWWLNSVQGFHAVMNVVLLPMWVLSGAVFPAESASRWMQYLMLINPLRLVVTSLHDVLYRQQSLLAFLTAAETLRFMAIFVLLVMFLGLFCVRQVSRAGQVSA